MDQGRLERTSERLEQQPRGARRVQRGRTRQLKLKVWPPGFSAISPERVRCAVELTELTALYGRAQTGELRASFANDGPLIEVPWLMQRGFEPGE